MAIVDVSVRCPDENRHTEYALQVDDSFPLDSVTDVFWVEYRMRQYVRILQQENVEEVLDVALQGFPSLLTQRLSFAYLTLREADGREIATRAPIREYATDGRLALLLREGIQSR